MANWTTLKAAIADVIKTNGNQEITGAVLQNTLNSIVSAVGENATFAGIATPVTNPGTPDGPVFYIAAQTGIYSNFEGITVENEVAILLWKTSWKKLLTNIAPLSDISLIRAVLDNVKLNSTGKNKINLSNKIDGYFLNLSGNLVSISS